MKRMKKWLSLAAVAALALPLWAAKDKVAASAKEQAACCCKQIEGKLVCQETGQVLEQCCCD